MKTLRAIVVLTAILVPVAPATAQIPSDVARIEVIPGWRGSDGLHRGALDITLAPGWKTYWRAPGEGGIPPLFNWSGSENLRDLDVSFPVPDVYVQNGLRSYGYETRVTLPFVARPRRAGDAIALTGEIELGVCLDVCIPVQVNLSALLPTPGTHDPAIEDAFMDRPATAAEAGLGAMTCRIEPISDGLRVSASLRVLPMGGEEFAVMEHPDPSIWVSPANIRRAGNDLTATADMVPPSAQPFVLSRDSIKLTLLADGQAVEITGCS